MPADPRVWRASARRVLGSAVCPQICRETNWPTRQTVATIPSRAYSKMDSTEHRSCKPADGTSREADREDGLEKKGTESKANNVKKD